MPRHPCASVSPSRIEMGCGALGDQRPAAEDACLGSEAQGDAGMLMVRLPPTGPTSSSVIS